MKKKSKNKNYSLGTAVITLITILCAFSLFLPMLSGEYSISIVNTVFGKNAGGAAVISPMGIFGIVSAAVIVIPLITAFIVSLWPFNRIKKYVIVFFLSVVLLFGFLIVNFLVSSKYSEKSGMGFYLEVLLAAALLFSSLYFIHKDHADKKQKAIAWYSILNKIILLICLPLATAMLVFAITMFDLISNMSVLTSIGVFLLIAGTVIAAVVAIFASFEKYKSGFLYFLTGGCWALGIIFCMASASLTTLLFGIVVALVVAFFWMSLGTISQKYF